MTNPQPMPRPRRSGAVVARPARAREASLAGGQPVLRSDADGVQQTKSILRMVSQDSAIVAGSRTSPLALLLQEHFATLHRLHGGHLARSELGFQQYLGAIENGFLATSNDRLIVDAQAGFFSEAELAGSQGVRWDVTSVTPRAGARLDPLPAPAELGCFDAAQVRAFAEGRMVDCFGAGFAETLCHTATPTIQSGPMQFIHSIAAFEPMGGPWQRGYTRAVQPISGDDFFASHVLSDPSMPVTLLAEAALQAVAFHMTACGFTLRRDGYRFEPVPGQSIELSSSGQVSPQARELVTEVFIEEVADGPTPTVVADVLISVDGVKALHCRHLGLRLVPDWPLSDGLPARDTDDRTEVGDAGPVAECDGVRFDRNSLLAWALGRPSAAFGPRFARFDDGRPFPRMAAPPFLFVSRVSQVDGPLGGMQSGSAATVHYDVGSEPFHASVTPDGRMPASLVIETALQACAWLGTYAGGPLSSDDDLSFRVTEAKICWFGYPPRAGSLTNRVVLKSAHRWQGTLLMRLTAESEADGSRLMSLEMACGLFPRQALTGPSDATVAVEHDHFTVEATANLAGLLDCLPQPPMRMIDCITGFAAAGGSAGLGQLSAVRRIGYDDWYFKAHFFRDPVQPGSLGVEAMLQSTWLLLLAGGHASPSQRVYPAAATNPVRLRFRGQVQPFHGSIRVETELTSLTPTPAGLVAVAKAALWAADTLVYECQDLALLVCP